MIDRELYQYRIDHTLCTNCGEPIKPKSGRLCPTCAKLKRTKAAIKREEMTEEERQKQAEYCKTWREKHKGYNKMRYAMMKAQGVCVQCGKPKENPSRVRCNACGTYQSEKLRERNQTLSEEQKERKKEYLREYHRKKKEKKSMVMSRKSTMKQLERMKMDKSHTGDEHNAIMAAIRDLKSINALSKDLKSINRELMKEDALIGFNMAVALFNKHLGGTE